MGVEEHTTGSPNYAKFAHDCRRGGGRRSPQSSIIIQMYIFRRFFRLTRLNFIDERVKTTADTDEPFPLLSSSLLSSFHVLLPFLPFPFLRLFSDLFLCRARCKTTTYEPNQSVPSSPPLSSVLPFPLPSHLHPPFPLITFLLLPSCFLPSPLSPASLPSFHKNLKFRICGHPTGFAMTQRCLRFLVLVEVCQDCY